MRVLVAKTDSTSLHSEITDYKLENTVDYRDCMYNIKLFDSPLKVLRDGYTLLGPPVREEYHPYPGEVRYIYRWWFTKS